MKNLATILFFFSLAIANLQAQDVLLFLESTYDSRQAIPLSSCMQQTNALLSTLEESNAADRATLKAHAEQLTFEGKHDIAAEVLEQLLEITKKEQGKNSVIYARSLVDLARVYILLIKYSNAIGMYEEALTIVEQSEQKNTIEHLTLLNEVGMLSTRAKEYSIGLRYFEDARKIMDTYSIGSDLQRSILSNNIGTCYKNLGDYAQAVTYYRTALEANPRKTRIAASMAANLAEALVYVGGTAEAKGLLEQYKRGLQTAKNKKDSHLTRAWTQFGLAYLTLGDLDQCESSLQQAFEANSRIYDNVTDIPNQAHELMFDNEFLATCGQAGVMMYSIELYKTRYEATKDIKYLQEGYKIVEALGQYGEQLTNSYAVEDNKLKLFRLGAAILFDRSIYYAYHLHQATNQQQYIEDAFFLSERSKSTLLVSALSDQQNQHYLKLPAATKKEQKKLQDAAKVLEKKYVEAPSVAQKSAVQAEINALQLQIEQFKKEVKKVYPDYYQHRYDSQLTSLKDLQSNLTEQQVLIEYFLGVQYNYAFVVTPNSLDLVALDLPTGELNRQTRQLRQCLTDYTFLKEQPKQAKNNFAIASSYFYEQLLAPILTEKTKGKHLIIVPDGALGHLPFEVFLTKPIQGDYNYAQLPYLLHDYSVSYGYSATIYSTQLSQAQHRTPAQKGVLAMAADYKNKTTESTQVRSSRGANLRSIRSSLSPLPGAKAEVKALKEHLYGAFFDDIKASEQRFKQTAGDYNIIHLAMHGVLDSRSPILSSLVFSEDNTEQEDNFLRAYEIAQMELNADLVVLSACETGYGKFQQGEGIMSLAHSFTYAGASSVLNSLWQVNDYSTGKIMTSFYQNIAEGNTKDKALQLAKLEYLKTTKAPNAQHPAYWAAFVQQGNVAPLELVCKAGFSSRQIGYMIAGVFGLLILGGFVWWKKR